MTLLYAPSTGDAGFKVGARRLDIRDFNALPDMEACAALTRCCGSTRWVQAMLARRPFDSFADLFAAADRIWWSLESEDWLEAFSHHPELGDVSSLRRRFAPSFDGFSAAPPAGGQAPEHQLLGLLRGSAAYEKRFGFRFIIDHSDKKVKKAADLLAILQKRLRNDVDLEIRQAAEQQRRITSQRLTKWLTS